MCVSVELNMMPAVASPHTWVTMTLKLSYLTQTPTCYWKSWEREYPWLISTSGGSGVLCFLYKRHNTCNNIQKLYINALLDNFKNRFPDLESFLLFPYLIH